MANPSSTTGAAATSTPPDPPAATPPLPATTVAPIPTNSIPSRPYQSPNPSPPLLPLPPSFASHSILGRPPAPPPLPPTQSILYPLGLATRGFPPSKSSIRGPTSPADQMVTVANPAAGYMRNTNPTAGVIAYPGAHSVRPYGFPHTDHTVHGQQQQQQQQQPVVAMRPQPQQPMGHTILPQFAVPKQVPGGGNAVTNGPPHPPPPHRVIPSSIQPKASSFSATTSAPEYNNYKELREKSRDDSIVTIHTRKVRLLDAGSGSLYALCRSWVRNGVPQESQPSFGDGVKLLPKPLPINLIDSAASKKNESEDEDSKKEENGGSDENLSTHDLLEGHIKNAKRIRAKLREERLQRIDRYKQRLSLLLPLPMEQSRSDAAPGS